MRTRSSKPRPNVWANEHCRTYDPNVEGYGSPDQWKAAFQFRMGLDAARETVGKRSTLGIIFSEEMPVGWSARTVSDQWKEIKSAWRKLVMKFHPDNQTTGNADKFKMIQGAYEILESEYRRKGVTV
jgi:hypothetical protein